ncbi:hypothetical protein Pmani_031894 [Petrolisthes manimaculis]|uniref:Uncharacterized protein n=1 Tax=Petrolisthes manimaculis TaxID=1843537 RepID=A0AAE1NSU0_9EUCA|nr:hypothetical protein Pmani_031894 [Petrolisthes manimaculis]
MNTNLTDHSNVGNIIEPYQFKGASTVGVRVGVRVGVDGGRGWWAWTVGVRVGVDGGRGRWAWTVGVDDGREGGRGRWAWKVGVEGVAKTRNRCGACVE